MRKNPIFRLPPREACLTCPHFSRRLRFELPGEPSFKDLVEDHSVASMVVKGLAGALDPTPLPIVRLGIDPFSPVAQVVQPGFEDLDQIEDDETLTLALRDIGLQPVCDCARRLLDVVAGTPWPGPAIAARTVVVETKALPPPNKVKGPGCRKSAPVDLFAAFGEDSAPVAIAPTSRDGVQEEGLDEGAEERDRLRNLPGDAGVIQRLVWGRDDDELNLMLELETD